MEGPAKGRSQVVAMLEQQATLTREMIDITKLLVEKEVEISLLKSELQKTISRGLGTSNANNQVL